MPAAIHLFGHPRVAFDDGVRPIRLKRVALLLALLIAKPDGIAKEALAEQLWAEGDASSRRNRLRRLTFEARALLGAASLVETSGRLALEGSLLARSDLHAWSLRQQAPVEELSAAMIATARAPLLGDTVFDELSPAAEWLNLQRMDQAIQCRRLRDRMVEYLLLGGDPSAALTLLLGDLPADPLDAAGWERAARLLAAAGHHGECLALYQTLRRHLARELDAEPSPSFQLLAREAEAKQAARELWRGERAQIRYVESGGVHLAYQVFGHGHCDLLLIPGFVSNLDMVWELPELAGLLSVLGQHFRVISYDRRGVGLSDRHIGQGGMDAAVDDAVAVLDAAGSSRALVFGASEGGPLAIALASAHAGRISGLCLFGTLAKGSADGDYTSALSAEQYDLWLDALVRSWGTADSLAAFCPSRANDAPVREWWARMLRMSSSPQAIARILAQLRDIDVRHMLPGMRSPVTLLHRRGDRAVRIEAGRYLAAQLTQARMVELEGEDHWWWQGDNDILLAELLRLRDTRISGSV